MTMQVREARFLELCELHDAAGLTALVAGGFDPRIPIRGKAPVNWLLEMYTRSDRLRACLAVLLAHGAVVDDPAILPVLLDDVTAVRARLADDPGWLAHRTTLASAFTPLDEVSLLHVAAEYGYVDVARALLDAGADVNARAGTDGVGLGGHTPLFHTVNAHANRPLPVLRLLIEHGADPSVRLQGLTWGRGCPWETTLFDLTPVSYAQAGLLPQMHRREADVYEVVRLLLEAAGRPVPPLANVPNRYLLER